MGMDMDVILLNKLQILLGERGPDGSRAVRLKELEQYIPLAQLNRLLSVPDGNYGDLTVSGGVWSLNGGVVTNAKLASDVWSSNQVITGAWAVGNGTGASTFDLNGAAGAPRSLRWRSGGVDRWAFNADALAESGGNSGSRFFLGAFDDAGGFLGTAFVVTRATQVVDFTQSPTIGGTTLAETIDDRVNALLVAGSGITKTYNDVANTLTLSATGGGGGAYSPAQGWAF